MSIKIFTISFLLTSLIFSLLYIPTHLTNFTTPPPPKSLIFPNKSTPTPTYPISFAYLISASKGDADKVKRAVRALYHPANHYLIHMDFGAAEKDHREIAGFVAGEPVFRQVGNVWVVGKPNLVTYRGPTMLATTLHAMAMLLRINANWDWFINLSASDYPLVTQDGMVSALFFIFFYTNGTHCDRLRKNRRESNMGMRPRNSPYFHYVITPYVIFVFKYRWTNLNYFCNLVDAVSICICVSLIILIFLFNFGHIIKLTRYFFWQ